MHTKTLMAAGAIAASLMAAVPPASAQSSKGVELGASLMNLSIVKPTGGGSTQKLFGMPTGTLGIGGPGVYATFFATRHIGIEPQATLLVLSVGGDSSHVVNIAGQLDYFTAGHAVSSPFLFASAGVIDISAMSTNPKTVGAGLGYRWRMGGRLCIRVDGRYNHLTDDGGNMVAFNVSIGGLFGQ
jgi:hypothetical protein